MQENQKVVAFDLETIADLANLPEFDEDSVKVGNIKDPAKIKLKLIEAKEKHITEAGLKPQYNKVCCFGWCDGEITGHILLSEENGGEKKLLLEAWDILARYDHFVTFNGIDFDVPIMNLHSLFAGIRPGVKISTRKYVVENHTDLRAILGNYNKFAPGKLDFYLQRCLGLSKPEGIDGSMVQHYWDVGMENSIATYCESDAENTFKLFRYVSDYYLF